MTTQATIIASFGEEAAAENYHVVIELDDQLNKDSDGDVKTTFNPGNEVYFLVQHDSRVRINSIKSSKGQVQALGSVTRTRTKNILFAEAGEEQQFGYLGSSSVEWLGNTAGIVDYDGINLRAVGGNFPAMGRVSKSTTFSSYKLVADVPTLSEDEDYPIGVVVYMEAL
jgi:hypothetical protein